MKKSELIAALLGTLGGSVLSLAVTWCFVDHAGLWLAPVVGGILGLVGGALGQNFIEGVVIALVCAILLTILLLAPFLPPWSRELGVGILVGNAVGWVIHGSLVP